MFPAAQGLLPHHFSSIFQNLPFLSFPRLYQDNQHCNQHETPGLRSTFMIYQPQQLPGAPAHRRDQKDAAAQPHCQCALRKDGQSYPAAELLPQTCSPSQSHGWESHILTSGFWSKESGLLLKKINKFKEQNESHFVHIFLHFRLAGWTLLTRSSSQGKHIPTKPFCSHGERRVPPPSMTESCTGRSTGRAWQPAERFISVPPAQSWPPPFI